MTKKLFVILALVVLCSLVFASRVDKASAKLQQELSKLQSLRAEGVIQVNYRQLALRRMFVFAKNKDELRIDIIDGGIAGAGAEPLFSFYLGDYPALRSPLMPQLENYDLSRLLPSTPARVLDELSSVLMEHTAEIAKTKRLQLNGVSYKFDKKYRLLEISDDKAEIKVNLTYNRRGDIDTLVLKQQGKEVLNLLIDKVSYEDVEVVPFK